MRTKNFYWKKMGKTFIRKIMVEKNEKIAFFHVLDISIT